MPLEIHITEPICSVLLENTQTLRILRADERNKRAAKMRFELEKLPEGRASVEKLGLDRRAVESRERRQGAVYRTVVCREDRTIDNDTTGDGLERGSERGVCRDEVAGRGAVIVRRQRTEAEERSDGGREFSVIVECRLRLDTRNAVLDV